MSVTITFHTVAERTPKHGQAIIYLKPFYSFGFEDFHPMECEVEYIWIEKDEEGEVTGNAVTYTDGDGDQMDGHTLEIMFDGVCPDDNWLWISVDEYHKSFE